MRLPGLTAGARTPDAWARQRWLAQLGALLQAGMVHINGAEMSLSMPFGGFKRSGLGRKFGPEGLKAYLEPQSILLPAT